MVFNKNPSSMSFSLSQCQEERWTDGLPSNGGPGGFRIVKKQNEYVLKVTSTNFGEFVN